MSDQQQARPGAVVSTESGDVRGETSGPVSIFRGIPYGASTGGENRFRPPQPVTPWSGVRECRRYGDTAPQAATWLAEGGEDGNRPEIGEDCLVLNVWTPSPDASRRPVMVWLHGGGFEAGTGSVMLYDGSRLAERGDVVVVTINHRLGVMGHLHLADLVGAEFDGSVNAGVLDIFAALRWVQINIDGFGGDPSNVTIFGQSGGGRKVSLATAAPDADGLFHRAIVQSGSQLLLDTRERANDLAERLFAQLEIPVGDIGRLRRLPMKEVLRAGRKVGRRFAPAIDGVVFHDHPWDPAAPVTARAVPMMIGTCRTELSGLMGLIDPSSFDVTTDGLAERLAPLLDEENVAVAVRLAQEDHPGAAPSELLFTIATTHTYWRDAVAQTERKSAQSAAGGAPAWSYELTWRTPIDGGRRVTPHSLDLPFVFDNVARAAHMVGPESDETASMAEMMSESWLAFARTGSPENATVPAWPSYDLDRRAVMQFDTPSLLVDDPHRAQRRRLDGAPVQRLGRLVGF